MSILRITYDTEADAAYIYLQPPTAMQPSVASTVTATRDVNLDFDSDGRLIGIEILGRSVLHPELIAELTNAP